MSADTPTLSLNQSKDFDNLKVADLRIFLRERGLPVSGSKPDLIRRAKGSLELGTKPLSEVAAADAHFDRKVSVEKAVTPLGERLPPVNEMRAGWSGNLDKLPSFTDMDLYNYMVLNDARTFDSKPINAKRQLKAKVFYTDKHLHSVEYHHIDQQMSHCYVRAKCIR